MNKTPEQLPLPMEVPGLALEETTLKAKYLDAIKDLYCPWALRHPRHRFAEYDKYRAIWCEELVKWRTGPDPWKFNGLTDFAWRVQHERISEGGQYFNCLNWSDRRQRVYLGDGLLEYLGLLKDEVKRVYPARPTATVISPDFHADEPEYDEDDE